MYHHFFFMHLPMALHLAGAGHPAQGLNAPFLAGAALTGGIFFPYIIAISFEVG